MIIKSNFMLEKVVRQLDLQNEYKVNDEAAAIRKLKRNIKIESNLIGKIIMIRVRDQSAARARKILRIYLAELQKINQDIIRCMLGEKDPEKPVKSTIMLLDEPFIVHENEDAKKLGLSLVVLFGGILFTFGLIILMERIR